MLKQQKSHVVQHSVHSGQRPLNRSHQTAPYKHSQTAPTISSPIKPPSSSTTTTSISSSQFPSPVSLDENNNTRLRKQRYPSSSSSSSSSPQQYHLISHDDDDNNDGIIHYHDDYNTINGSNGLIPLKSLPSIVPLTQQPPPQHHHHHHHHQLYNTNNNNNDNDDNSDSNNNNNRDYLQYSPTLSSSSYEDINDGSISIPSPYDLLNDDSLGYTTHTHHHHQQQQQQHRISSKVTTPTTPPIFNTIRNMIHLYDSNNMNVQSPLSTQYNNINLIHNPLEAISIQSSSSSSSSLSPSLILPQQKHKKLHFDASTLSSPFISSHPVVSRHPQPARRDEQNRHNNRPSILSSLLSSYTLCFTRLSSLASPLLHYTPSSMASYSTSSSSYDSYDYTHYVAFGLGNPGQQYINTRHNIGSDMIKQILSDLDIPLHNTGYHSHYTNPIDLDKVLSPYLIDPLMGVSSSSSSSSSNLNGGDMLASLLLQQSPSNISPLSSFNTYKLVCDYKDICLQQSQSLSSSPTGGRGGNKNTTTNKNKSSNQASHDPIPIPPYLVSVPLLSTGKKPQNKKEKMGHAKDGSSTSSSSSKIPPDTTIHQHLTQHNIRPPKYKLTLAVPDTYMNLSGASIQALSHHLRVPPSNIIVIHDDIDIPVGEVKLKRGGSAGGQRGINNILERLGSTHPFLRVRIGVGRPHDNKDVADWVLGKPSPTEQRDMGYAFSSMATSLLDYTTIKPPKIKHEQRHNNNNEQSSTLPLTTTTTTTTTSTTTTTANHNNNSQSDINTKTLTGGTATTTDNPSMSLSSDQKQTNQINHGHDNRQQQLSSASSSSASHTQSSRHQSKTTPYKTPTIPASAFGTRLMMNILLHGYANTHQALTAAYKKWKNDKKMNQ